MISPEERLFQKILDDFEDGWIRGGERRFEDLRDALAALPPAFQGRGLREAFLIELHHRDRRGENPISSEFHQRCPDMAGLIDAVFAKWATDQADQIETSTTYRKLDVIGEGGFGTVWKATDTNLNRIVALKGVHERHVDNQKVLDSTAAEAEVTARLQHPGIVPILSRGKTRSGIPFYTMPLIRGQTLKEAIDHLHEKVKQDPNKFQKEFRRLLTVFAYTCKVVGYAHDKGVLHRDLTPTNIMLGEFGEVHVIDWGLHKFIPIEERVASDGSAFVSAEGPSCASALGTIKGNPAYMSPEQARGASDQVTLLSDVYGLGAILFHILTGRAPREEKSVKEMLRQARDENVPSPRNSNRSVPHNLDAICRKALAREPDKRYGSAVDLADDIESWLAGEPVKARHEPFHERAGRWVGKHRPQVAAASSFILTGLLIAGGLWYREHVRDQDRRAEIAWLCDHAQLLFDRGWHIGDIGPINASLKLANDALALAKDGPPSLKMDVEGRVDQLKQHNLDAQTSLEYAKRALAHYSSGDVASAAELVRASKSRWQYNREAAWVQTCLFFEGQCWDEAQAELERCHGLPGEFIIDLMKGEILWRKDHNLSAAIARHLNRIEHWRGEPIAWLTLFDQYARVNQWEDAISTLRLARKQGPHPMIDVALADVLSKSGDAEEALEILAPLDASKVAGVLETRVWCYRVLNRYEEAARAIQAAQEEHGLRACGPAFTPAEVLHFQLMWRFAAILPVGLLDDLESQIHPKWYLDGLSPVVRLALAVVPPWRPLKSAGTSKQLALAEILFRGNDVLAAAKLYDHFLDAPFTAPNELFSDQCIIMARAFIEASQRTPDRELVEHYRNNAIRCIQVVLQGFQPDMQRSLPGQFRSYASSRLALLLRYLEMVPELASVRSPTLEQLPEDEQAPWRELWARIAELRSHLDELR